MSDWRNWLDSRTGYKGLVHEALFENVPGGARWRYVWGSTLTFFFVVQVITGIALWMSYSPSSQTAWESVYWIQNQMWGGWLLRGIHHFAAQAMTALLVLHLMQVVIDGAYKAPREVNYWFGVALLLLQLVQTRTQDLPRRVTVGVLRALILDRNGSAGWNVRQPDRRRGLVHLLAAGAA